LEQGGERQTGTIPLSVGIALAPKNDYRKPENRLPVTAFLENELKAEW